MGCLGRVAVGQGRLVGFAGEFPSICEASLLLTGTPHRKNQIHGRSIDSGVGNGKNYIMREEVVSLGPFTNSADDDVQGVPAVDASSVSVLYDTFADDAMSATNKQHPSNDSNGSNGRRSSSSSCCSGIIFDRATRRLLQR